MIIMIYGAPRDPWAARMSSREREEVGPRVTCLTDDGGLSSFRTVLRSSIFYASPAGIFRLQSVK